MVSLEINADKMKYIFMFRHQNAGQVVCMNVLDCMVVELGP